MEEGFKWSFGFRLPWCCVVQVGPMSAAPAHGSQAPGGDRTGRDPGNASESRLKAEIINTTCSRSKCFPSPSHAGENGEQSTEGGPTLEFFVTQRWDASSAVSSVGFFEGA